MPCVIVLIWTVFLRRAAAVIVTLSSMLIATSAPLVFAENLTLTVRGDSPAGPLPTWYEPSSFFVFTTDRMKQEFRADAGKTSGMFVQSIQYLLGASTSLADYKTRLSNSGLAQEARAIGNAGAQVLVMVAAMPAWLSSSTNTAVPPGCTGEWPIYKTVSPDPAKWSSWDAVVRETVTYFNVTNRLTNVWFEFWPEADGPCFWTDSQAKYLETWHHFAAAARSADPKARLGGPAPGGGPGSTRAGESVPIMQAFIDYSAAQGIKLDFVAYHLFDGTPEEGRLRNRTVRSMLAARGLAQVPIVVSSWNPMQVCGDPSFPSQPSALGCWQTDNEMGASFSLALMSHLSKDGATGYQIMYTLDDANVGGTEEFPHDWGLRTSSKKNGIRKAIYHAHTIVGRMPRTLVTSTIGHAYSTAEYFEHVSTISGTEGDKLSILVWSYVTSPWRQAQAILRDMGYRISTDFARWGGQAAITSFIIGNVPASALTPVAKEQTDLQTMKNAFYRQSVLVTETNRVTFAVSGFPSGTGYRVTRYLIDSTHNNAYNTYVSSGLQAAIAGQGLQVLDTRQITSLADVPAVDLKPYSVMLIEIERNR